MNTTTRWPSVDRSPTPTGWARPGNLMPAVGPSSWPRGRRATSEAEEILATAEAWWDVDRSGFRDGDRFLRNIGTAGSALDLRLGSSGVANSNDPKWLGPEDTGYAYLPGVLGNHLSTSLTTLSSVAAVDFAVRVSLDSFASTNWLAGWQNTHVAFWLQTDKKLVIRILNTSVLTIGEATSSIAVPSITAGQPIWLRGKVTVATAACEYSYSYDQTNDESAVTWTVLGTTVVGSNAATTPLLSQSGSPLVGSTSSSVAGFAGKLHAAAERIDGSIRQRIDCDAITSGAATTFTATTGQTVTINRSTSGRKSVAIPSRAKGGRPCMLLGTDDYLECLDAAQHGLLNFYGGDSFTVLACVRMWANPSGIFHMLVAKGVSTNTGFPGWFLFRGNGTAAMRLQLNDTATAIGGAATQNIVNGTNSTVVGVRNLQGRVMGVSINGAVLTTINDTTSTGFVTNNQVRVGNRSSGSDFADMEFSAAAIFRRALTAREITVINNAAPWGI